VLPPSLLGKNKTMTKKSSLIFYLDRQKLIIAGTQLAVPLTLDFPASIVLDIDIIDIESFDLLLGNFLEQSQIAVSDVLLVVSPEVYYEKDTSLSLDPTERQNQIDLFSETIPFKHLIFKDYSLGTPRLIALNKNFYEPAIKLIEKKGFNIFTIIPFFVLGHFNLKLENYQPAEVKEIFKKIKLLDPLSIISSQDIDKMVTTQIHKPKEDSKRTYILLAVFCFLFVSLLAFVLLGPRLLRPGAKKTYPPPSIISTPIPTKVLISPIPTVTFLSEETLRIKVVNSSGVANQAAAVKQALTAAGLKEITIGSSSKVTAANNQISFSPNVSPESRQKITAAAEKIAGVFTETESTDLTNIDVLITTTFKPGTKATP
jgi:hypothetical protein